MHWDAEGDHKSSIKFYRCIILQTILRLFALRVKIMHHLFIFSEYVVIVTH